MWVFHTDALADESGHKDVALRHRVQGPPQNVVRNTVRKVHDIVKQGWQIGKVFSGESLFARIPFAGKICFTLNFLPGSFLIAEARCCRATTGQSLPAQAVPMVITEGRDANEARSE